MADRPHGLLLLCVANSSRSQMAEGFAAEAAKLPILVPSSKSEKKTRKKFLEIPVSSGEEADGESRTRSASSAADTISSASAVVTPPMTARAPSS